jgi:hypothetical protein
MQKLNQSVEIWESVAKEKTSESFWACVELAKYYEHHLRDFKSALEYTRLAQSSGLIKPRQFQEIEKRAFRLSRKLKSTGDN